jgi:hypothetical protein
MQHQTTLRAAWILLLLSRTQKIGISDGNPQSSMDFSNVSSILLAVWFPGKCLFSSANAFNWNFSLIYDNVKEVYGSIAWEVHTSVVSWSSYILRFEEKIRCQRPTSLYHTCQGGFLWRRQCEQVFYTLAPTPASIP